MSLYLGENCISAGGSSAFRNTNIGEIITSTIPLNDAGLHLLDGSLISGEGSYKAFYDYIVNLYNTYPQLYTDEAGWQSAVSTYGVCGKFVFNTTNNTVRLPKITGFTEGTTDVTALGDLIKAGLPNVIGRFGAWESNASHKIADEGPFTTTSTGGGEQNGNGTWNTTTMNLSRANPIYGNSSTVQPQSIKVLYYIVIANSVKTNIEVDIDEVMTDLNGKADVDLSNSTVPHIVETYVNGTSWYRIWSADSTGKRWCEQGGKFVITTASIGGGGYNTATLTFLKPFNKCITYNVQAKHDRFNAGFATEINGQALSQVSVYQVNDSGTSFVNPYVIWQAYGYIS